MASDKWSWIGFCKWIEKKERLSKVKAKHEYFCVCKTQAQIKYATILR